MLALLTPVGVADAATGDVPCGDSSSLIRAIDTANKAGEPTTITIRPQSGGSCVFTLTVPASLGTATAGGANGLPAITGDVTIARGAGVTSSPIARAVNAPDFRIAEVSAGGHLTLRGITLTGGRVKASGAGIDNDAGGTLTLLSSTVTRNTAIDIVSLDDGGPTAGGGGILNQGLATLTDSTISDNDVTSGEEAIGGGIASLSATLSVKNSRILRNHARVTEQVTLFGGARGGGISIRFGSAALTLEDSMVQGNTVSGWIAYAAGLELQRPATIVRTDIAGNVATAAVDAAPPPCQDEVDTSCNADAAFAGAAVWNQSFLQMADSRTVGNVATATGSPHSLVEGAGLTNSGSFEPRPGNPGPGRAVITRTLIAGNVARAVGSGSEVRGSGIANQDGLLAGQRGPGDPPESSFLALHGSQVVGNVGLASVVHGAGIDNYVNGIQEHPSSEPGGGRSQQQLTLDEGTIVIGNSPDNCAQQIGTIAGCGVPVVTFPPGSP